MHIDKTYRRAYNIEPNMCWEYYSCVKACPQNAIDVRGYADFAPLGHSVRVLREEAKATISWKLKFRDGREKNFISPIRTTPWGSIKGPAEYAAPRPEDCRAGSLRHQLLHGHAMGREPARGPCPLHQLQRTWELHHRLLASESVTHHTLFREETRWPGYYYRGDHIKLDDQNWHCFTLSRYDRRSGSWAMEKAPVYHIID